MTGGCSLAPSYGLPGGGGGGGGLEGVRSKSWRGVEGGGGCMTMSEGVLQRVAECPLLHHIARRLLLPSSQSVSFSSHCSSPSSSFISVCIFLITLLVAFFFLHLSLYLSHHIARRLLLPSSQSVSFSSHCSSPSSSFISVCIFLITLLAALYLHLCVLYLLHRLLCPFRMKE